MVEKPYEDPKPARPKAPKRGGGGKRPDNQRKPPRAKRPSADNKPPVKWKKKPSTTADPANIQHRPPRRSPFGKPRPRPEQVWKSRPEDANNQQPTLQAEAAGEAQDAPRRPVIKLKKRRKITTEDEQNNQNQDNE